MKLAVRDPSKCGEISLKEPKDILEGMRRLAGESKKHLMLLKKFL
jgi:hypothetical protein